MKNAKIRFVSLLLSVLMTAGVFCFVPAGAEPASEAQTRTVMFYLIGSNLERQDGTATWNLIQAMNAEFDENLNFIVMTGGAKKWNTDSAYLEGADKVSSSFDQIWKLEGRRDGEDHGRMILLEPTGIEGFEKANMSVPETLTAFIDYCYDNYPADLYDLILWDHGGGFTYGFGNDERYGYGMLSMKMMIDAFERSELIEGGKKFEIIDFDACLMSTVEVVAALTPYADYLVVSPEYEPGYGQEYTTWLNAVRCEPQMNGFELGKRIVDGLVNFYNGENGGYESVGTLSVIDTANFADRLLGRLIALDDVLIEEAKSRGELNGRYNFYDEFYSLMTAYEFDDGYDSLYDLGNLVGSLSAPQSEMDNCSDEQIEEQVNAYTDVALQIISVLADCNGDGDDVIYAGASETTRKAVEGYFIRGLDGEFLEPEESGCVTVAPTGLSILFGDQLTENADLFVKMILEVLPLVNDETTREFFTKRAVSASYYSLITLLGMAVSELTDVGETPVSWDTVSRYIKQGKNRMLSGYFGTLVECLCTMDDFAAEDAVTGYLSEIVAQQADEAVSKDKVGVKRIVEADGTSSGYQVTVNDTSAHSLMSVDSYMTVTVGDYDSEEFSSIFSQYYSYLSIGYVYPSGIFFRACENEGAPDFNYFYESLNDSPADVYRRLYSSTSSVWTVPQMDGRCFVMYDSDGTEHPSQIIYKDRSKESAYVPVCIYYDDESYSDAYVSVSFSDGVWGVDGLSFSADEAIARSYYPMDSDYFVGAKYAASGMLTDRNGNNFTLPVSRFCDVDVTEKNWGISFEWKNAEDISEIDSTAFGFSVSDIYGHRIDVTDLFREADAAAERGEVAYSVDCADFTVGDAVYDGHEQRPDVTVTLNGEALEKGIDYKVLYFGGGPGQAYAVILGIGDLVGTAYAPYTVKCAEHSYELTDEVPATCTVSGTRDYVCSVCGDEYTENIAPTGHAPVHVEAEKATMRADGNTEYWFCANCGAYFSDEKCENGIDPGDTVVVFIPTPGDINGDGEVNAKDLIRLMKYLADSGTEVNATILDVNKDGSVNSADLVHLMKYLAGLNVNLYG